MNEKLNYETYLYISSNKLIIIVNDNLDKKIYKDEVAINTTSNKIISEKLEFILNKNIFQIEKKLKTFIEKVFVIIDLDIFFSVEVSVKKNTQIDKVTQSDINYLLYEAKDCCKKTIEKKKIIHMVINKYKIDNKDYSLLPNDIKCNNFSLEVNFNCISHEFIEDLEKILKKFQISINQIISANYIKNFIKNNDEDVFLMTKKIINGHNPNEVKLVNKTRENKGFFEKFFNFFN